ncbi:FAD-dependent monooxygenase [Lacisediminihabitans sp. FW035]
MSAVQRVAIAGGGFAGAAAAIILAESGVDVDVFEEKPSLSALGSGITLQGNALRVLRQLGVWDAVRRQSYSFDMLGLRAPDPAATLIAEFPDQRTGGPDLPATAGMYRPDLARILIDRATAVGANVQFGAKVTAFEASSDGVTVTLDGADGGHYDLLIGADGIHSGVRSLMGIALQPRHIGAGIWRAFVDRPASVTHTDLFYGGPSLIAGYCPTGEDSMYAYIVEREQDRSGVTPEEGVAIMKELASAYHGPWDDVRANLTTSSRVNYTWFTEHVVDGAWNRGPVVLIGDAAHSCPPTIAQGAAQALEDAAVLSELLLSTTTLGHVWAPFHERRVERATAVVKASTQLVTWLLENNRDGDIPGLMNGIAAMVSVPA